jgi:hypothetical protein
MVTAAGGIPQKPGPSELRAMLNQPSRIAPQQVIERQTVGIGQREAGILMNKLKT